MKKIIMTVLSSALFLTVLSPAYALSDCPPAQKVKGMPLKQSVASGFKNRWTLISDTFKSEFREWNVYFIVELPNATNAKEALQQGKEAFEKAIVINNNPVPYNSDGMTYCDYAREAKYTIAAGAMVEDGKQSS